MHCVAKRGKSLLVRHPYRLSEPVHQVHGDRRDAFRVARPVVAERYLEGQLRAIVGVEVRITRVEAKWKLSQNRPPADVDGVVTGLTADGALDTAAAVQAARRS